MKMIFDTILPGSRWKTFLPRATLNESQSTLDCSGACAAVARKWSGLARSRRGPPAQPEMEMDTVHLQADSVSVLAAVTPGEGGRPSDLPEADLDPISRVRCGDDHRMG